jgi:hypothetical protein
MEHTGKYHSIMCTSILAAIASALVIIEGLLAASLGQMDRLHATRLHAMIALLNGKVNKRRSFPRLLISRMRTPCT